MAKVVFLLLVSGLVLAATPARSRDNVATNWHDVVSDADRDRLRNARQAWTDALAKARTMNAKAIAAQGVLFDPNVALANAKPPAGSYRCRVFKLGAKGSDNLDFVAYPAFRCRVAPEGERARLIKLDGSQRPTGLLFDDGRYRQVFLGALVLGDETRAFDYGRDASRDMAGTVERLFQLRWRLTFPSQRFESLLDVIELTPAR